MQSLRTFSKPSNFPRQPRIETQGRALSLQQEQISALWWKRAVTAAAIGYVLFSQTLKDVSGWSRLGIVFAALLLVLLVFGRISGAWSFSAEKWIWIPVPFFIYCFVRGIPKPGNEWPVDTLDPLVGAFCGGIGTALAVQVAVPFKAIVYAQVASNLCNIVAPLFGIGNWQAPGITEVRYSGVTGNANDFGLQLALGACLIWLLPKKAGLLPCLFAFFGIGFAVATSGSRTALMVAPFFLVMVFIQILASIKRHRAVAVISVMAVLCLMGTILAPAILEHAEDITAISRALEHKDNSYNVRLWMIRRGIQLWEEAPFFGHGVAGFARLSGYPSYAHNNYVELLCNTGLVGFLLFYGIHGYVVLKAIRLRGPLRLYSWVFILALLAIDVGSVNYYRKETIMLIMILLSIPVFQQRVRPGERNNGDSLLH